MKSPVMGIQLYTLRDYIQNPVDFDKTLDRLSKMGVDTVQISAIGDFHAEIQKEILDKYNMKVCVTHKGYDRMKSDLEGLIKEHKIIDCDALGLGCGTQEARENYEECKKFAQTVEGFGKVLKENGMTWNYHNHDFEFKTFPDKNTNMMDVLINETNPDYVHFIPDVAWLHYAGQNPVDYLKKMKNRVKVIHFKDYIIDENGERKFVSLGKGKVNLKECYVCAKELEIPYIMYEQDIDWVDDDPFKACEESWEFMKSLEK